MVKLPSILPWVLLCIPTWVTSARRARPCLPPRQHPPRFLGAWHRAEHTVSIQLNTMRMCVCVLLQSSSHILVSWSTVNRSQLLKAPLPAAGSQLGGRWGICSRMPQNCSEGWTHAANRQSASRFHFKLSRSKMSQGLGRTGELGT